MTFQQNTVYQLIDFFVIGTDTDVGKTYTSTLLYKALKECGYHYFKPVQSGCFIKNNRLTAPDVDFLCSFNNIPYDDSMVCYTLKEEVSPHLAAEKENILIDSKKIIEHYNNLKSKYKNLIVEGAGGLHVPLIRGKFHIYDLIKILDLPVVLVCGTKVGSINHSLLTINALKQMGIKLQGLVFNNYQGKFYEDDNIRVILESSNIKNYIIIKNSDKEIKKEELNKLFFKEDQQ